jgi:hypothetical protein
VILAGLIMVAAAAKAQVESMAAEAAQSRLLAGIYYQDGLILGRAIGGLAIDRAKTDGAG